MSTIAKHFLILAVFVGSKAQASSGASLQLVAHVPLRANVSVSQDPVTKKVVAINNGSQAIKVQTVSRFPASVVTIIAP